MTRFRSYQRYRGRSVNDATRRAREDLGEDMALVEVQVVSGTGARRAEIVVATTNTLGTPSLVEYLKNGPTARTRRRGSTLPERYQRISEQLVTLGMRPDQAEILCREAWEGDETLDSPPWQRIQAVLEQSAPCAEPLDLAHFAVLGLVGYRGAGRSQVAADMAATAAQQVNGPVGLMSAFEGGAPVQGVARIAAEEPLDVAAAVEALGGCALLILDLPEFSLRQEQLGLADWFSVFPELEVIPVLGASTPMAEVVKVVNAVESVSEMGWILSRVDELQHLGLIPTLALATSGPFAVQGHSDGRTWLEHASWDRILARMCDALDLDVGAELGLIEAGEEA